MIWHKQLAGSRGHVIATYEGVQAATGNDSPDPKPQRPALSIHGAHAGPWDLDHLRLNTAMMDFKCFYCSWSYNLCMAVAVTLLFLIFFAIPMDHFPLLWLNAQSQSCCTIRFAFLPSSELIKKACSEEKSRIIFLLWCISYSLINHHHLSSLV